MFLRTNWLWGWGRGDWGEKQQHKTQPSFINTVREGGELARMTSAPSRDRARPGAWVAGDFRSPGWRVSDSLSVLVLPGCDLQASSAT